MNANALEVMQQALEALHTASSCLDGYYIPPGKTTLPEIADAIAALDAAIATAEQAQPVAWQMPGTDSIITSATKAYREQLGDIHSTPLFTHPARTVSDEQLRELLPDLVEKHFPQGGRWTTPVVLKFVESVAFDMTRAAIEENKK